MLVLSVSWVGLLTGSSTMASISLRAAVGVGFVRVFLLPLGLMGLISSTAADESWDVVEGTKGRANYFLISSLYI